MKLLYFALPLAVCLAPTQEKSVAENSIEAPIRHVTVINVGNGSELKDQAVTIHGNRIASIAATQDSDNSLSNSIDARGAFLIPGLWDMHVHVHDVNELPLYIANGVTGIRVMSGQKDTKASGADFIKVYTRVPATHTSRWPPKQKNNTSILKATSPTPSPPRKPRAPVSAPWSISKASASLAPASSNP